jgi:hypothetical protein
MRYLGLTWSMEHLASVVCGAPVTGWTVRNGYTYAGPRADDDTKPPAR